MISTVMNDDDDDDDDDDGDDDDDTSVPMNEDSLFSIDRKLKALGLVGNLWKR